jgi:hypothetical protein
MQKEKFIIFLKGEGGLKPCEGERRGQGREETQGEREGRAAASRRSSEYGWNIVTGNEESNQMERKERYPGHLIKANMYTWCIYN